MNFQAEKDKKVGTSLRKRLERWNLPSFGRIVTERAETRLKAVFKCCQPRVGATLLTTWLNGWTTSRRMRGCSSSTFCCRICGKPGAEESIEHFAFCEKVQMVAQQIFHLPTSAEASSRRHHLQSFLCLDPDCDKTELRKRALLLQVTKYLFEICKNSGAPSSNFQLLDMSRLLLYRATRGGSGQEEGQWPRAPAHAGDRGRRKRGLPPLPSGRRTAARAQGRAARAGENEGRQGQSHLQPGANRLPQNSVEGHTWWQA